MLTGLTSMSLAIVGMVFLAKRVFGSYDACVETWVPECICGCSTADVKQTIKDTKLVYSRGAKLCMQQLIDTFIPQVYFAIYTTGAALGTLAAAAAFAEQAVDGEDGTTVKLGQSQAEDEDAQAAGSNSDDEF